MSAVNLFATKLFTILILTVGLAHGQSSQLTEEVFHRLINKVEQAYGPDLNQEGKILYFERLWADPFPTTFTSQKENISQINITGGLARLPSVDETTFLGIICHEVGHFLGGFPKFDNLKWASAEGQADYFATSKCLRKILRDDPYNKVIALNLDLPETIKFQCRESFADDNEYYICLRSAKASEKMGETLLLMKKQKGKVSLTRPDRKKVKVTELDYTSIQCRVDSALQGALCSADYLTPFDNLDETIGACHKRLGHTVGVRPNCWFKSL